MNDPNSPPGGVLPTFAMVGRRVRMPPNVVPGEMIFDEHELWVEHLRESVEVKLVCVFCVSVCVV